ncbi:MAG: hypothetical protein JOZ70_11490 [Pseudolabrys sp.]|nr:hypothetical protein [Pseudolabrys sp.]
MAWGEIRKFGWVKQRSAWADIEYHRARRAEVASNDQSSMDAINNAVTSALQSKISGKANLAGNAALKRVQAAAKAKAAETQKQIDQTIKKLDTAQTAADAAGVLNDPIETPGTTLDTTV